MSRTNAAPSLSNRHVRRRRWATCSGVLAPPLVIMLCVLLTTQVVGCGDDDNFHSSAATPTLTPPPIPSPTPTSKPLGGDIDGEALITCMAKNLVTDIGASELQDLLFPQSSVDYQTLINDFIAATQQLLTQQTVQEQAGMINGYMFSLNNDEGTWNNITDKTAQDNKTKEASIYSDVTSQASLTSASMGVLQQPMFAAQGFSAWMLGAQNYLNAVAFQTQMDPYLSSSDATAADNTTLANSFSTLTNYGLEEQSQIVYGSVVQAANRVTDCEKGDPCQGSDDCSYSYNDCFGHSHTYNYSLSDAAESCRSAQIPAVQTCADIAYWGCFNNSDPNCAQSTYKSQPNQLAWIGQTFDSWNQGLSALADKVSPMASPCATCAHALDVIALDPSNFDTNGQPAPIGSMTYGKVVTSTATDAIAEGQVRIGSSWAAAACNGRPTCDLKLATADFDLDKPFSEVNVTYQCGDGTDHYASVVGVGNVRLNDGAYFHFDCAPGIVGAQATFRGQPVQLSGTQTDVSTHSQLGPSIPKLTDNIYANEGASYNDTHAIVLPKEASDTDASAVTNALVIDLGSEYTLCGGMTCSTGFPKIQASGPDVFQIDTSTDGASWYDYALFPVAPNGESGLRTRPSIPEPNINARYVRVWARPGQDGKYGISELELFAVLSTGVQPISLNKPAFGPQPLITNGEYAPEGTSWDDTLYAVKLPNVGTTYAQTIDLGEVRSGINHVKVQADRNDTYQLDASVDGLVWTPLYLANRVSGNGLTTRDSGPLPLTAARYLRVYATDGDGEYSVSEVQVFSNRSLQQAGCNGRRVCYFSADELLRAELNGAAPTAQDANDLVVSWTCADDPTPRTANGVMWNSTPVVELRCPASPATCNTSEPTTCSPFAAERPDDVVYENVATMSYQICVSTQYPQCVPVIAGKTNYYRSNSSTMNKPACQNVRQAIADAITEGDCPAAPGEDPYGSSNAWPYNTAIGTPPANTCLPNPLGQPALLADVGCGPLLD